MSDFGELTVPLLMTLNKFKGALDEAESATKKSSANIAEAVANMGKTVVVGTVALAGAAIAGLGALGTLAINSMVKWGSSMDSIQDHLNTTNEESAGLGMMIESVGGNVDDITGSIDKMSKGLVNAKGELGPTGMALNKMNIQIYDTNGKMKSSILIFKEVSNRLADMPEGIEKNTLLMELFGKSGVDMGDALSASANGGLDEFTTKAIELGLAVDPSSAIEYTKVMSEFDMTIKGVSVSLGSKLLPFWNDLIVAATNLIQDNLPAISNFIDSTLLPALTDLSNWFKDTALPFISDFAVKSWEWLSKAWNDIISFIDTQLLPKFNDFINWFNGTGLPVIKDWASQAWTFLKGAWDNTMTYIDITLLPKFNEFAKWFDKTGLPAIKKFVKDIPDLEWTDVIGWINKGTKFIDDNFNSWANNYQTKLLFTSFGSTLGEAIVNGITATTNSDAAKSGVGDSLAKMFMNVVSYLERGAIWLFSYGIVGAIVSAFADIFTSKENADKIGVAVGDFVSNGLVVGLSLTNLGYPMRELAGKIVTEFSQNLNNYGNWLGVYIGNFITNAVNAGIASITGIDYFPVLPLPSFPEPYVTPISPPPAPIGTPGNPIPGYPGGPGWPGSGASTTEIDYDRLARTFRDTLMQVT